ncbi:MAG TPA: SRPBCC family protein [Candidatus Dormibacteraeota bacterium]|nr:SRPBCC family protein [Candidatus Dormibacteraeota bacterium]
MARFNQSVLIKRPLEQVFAYLADPENDPHWSEAADEMLLTSERPVRVGSTVRQLGHFLGRRLEFALEVTVYEPGHRFGMKVTSGPIRFAGIRTVEPVPEGTKVTFAGGGHSGGFFKIIELLVSWAANRQLGADLRSLKRVLEET